MWQQLQWVTMPKWAVFCGPQLVAHMYNGASNREAHRQWPNTLIEALNAIFMEME